MGQFSHFKEDFPMGVYVNKNYNLLFLFPSRVCLFSVEMSCDFLVVLDCVLLLLCCVVLLLAGPNLDVTLCIVASSLPLFL